MKSDFLTKYKTILEYTNVSGAYNVSEDDDAQKMGPENMDDSNMSNMGQDMNQDIPDTNMPDMSMDGAEGGVEGFNPEGSDITPMDGMGNDMNDSLSNAEPRQSDDEVIDVDELTKSQENAERKIDKMNDKFDKLMDAVEILVKQNAEREKAAIEQEKRLAAEIEKRIPTPQQRMTMRSTKSAPYAMTPNEYMNNYAPDNYSPESDNNGADDEQYKITKGDIDNFTDYNSIAKELDIEHQGLKDILGF